MICEINARACYLYAQIDFALSNFLPFDLTYGLAWEPGRPGAGPQCFLASLSFGPLRSKVFVPIIIIN